jgi:hypothetical protein
MQRMATRLERALATADAHNRRDARERAERRRVADWAPPRGNRGPDGRWLTTLLTRERETCGSPLEAAAVEQLRKCVITLTAARTEQDRKLRALSADANVALSALTSLEQGSAWPTFPVLAAVADTLGQRVQLSSPPPVRPDGEVLGLAGSEQVWRDHDQVGGGWHQLIAIQLTLRLAEGGLPDRDVAHQVGLDRETLPALRYKNPPASYASLRVLLALAAFTATTIEVVPATQPWPTLGSRLVDGHQAAAGNA